MWYVYILKCVDGTFFSGITMNLKKEVELQNSPVAGDKYVRARQPAALVYSLKMTSKSGAMIKECKIRKSSRMDKLALIRKNNEFLKRSITKF